MSSATVTSTLLLPLLRASGRAGRGFSRLVHAYATADPEVREGWQLGRLRALIRLAETRSAHYRDAFRKAGVSSDDLQDLEDLQRFPILEKTDLAPARARAMQTRAPRFCRWSRSAGSSGTPVAVAMNWQAWVRTLARRQELFRRHGLVYGHREARCWGRSSAGGVSVSDRLLSRRRFPFESDDPAVRRQELEDLIAFRPSYVYGYPSVVSVMLEALERRGESSLPVEGIVLTAERISGQLMATIAEVTGRPPVREYGCSETDIIAFDCPAGSYHVATDHVIVETVDVEDGIGQAVVTDLDNALMPLIRYRLGDRLRLSSEPCECGLTSPVIASIEGRIDRKRYFIMPDGRRRHGTFFIYFVEDAAAQGLPVRHFKIRQTALDQVLIHLDLGGEELPATLAEAMQQRLRDALGFAVRVRFEVAPLHRIPGSKWAAFEGLEAPTGLAPDDQG